MADLSFPNFGVPFPYANLIQQLQASMQNPTPGSYGRWGGSGLMAGNPTATGGGSTPVNATPFPGAVQGPGGTYPMPTAPNFVDPNRIPSGGITPNAPPGPPLTGTTAVGPGSMPGGPIAPPLAPPPTSTAPPNNGSPMVKPLSVDTKMAGGAPNVGLLGSNFQNVLAQNPVAAFNLMVKNNPGMLSQLQAAGYSPQTINSYGAGGGSNYHPNSMLPGMNGGQSSYGVVLGQGGIPEGQTQQQHMQNLMDWRNKVQMAAYRGDTNRYQQLLASAPSGAQVINMGGPTGPMNTGVPRG